MHGVNDGPFACEHVELMTVLSVDVLKVSKYVSCETSSRYSTLGLYSRIYSTCERLVNVSFY